MRTVTARFLEQLRESHVVVVEVDVIPPTGPPVPLELSGGEVAGDRSAQVRRTCSVEVAATTARELAGLPFGSYLAVRRGVRYGDRSTELVDLGLFRVDGVGSSTPAGSATITGSDRMAQVRDEPLLAPFAASGLIPSAAIVDLVEYSFPSIASNVSTTGEPTLADVVYNGDRARAVAELATSIAAEAYFDADGELVVAPVPDVTVGDAVWTIDAGAAGVLLGYDDSLERAGVANGVLVRGQADAGTPPLEVLVVDDEVGSPTEWGGPFGKVAAVIDSNAVQSVGQATELGELELRRRLGLTRTLALTSAPNPALEPGDLVDVVLADGTTERHVLDRIRVPLSPAAAITIETRATVHPSDLLAAVHVGAAAHRELVGARAAA